MSISHIYEWIITRIASPIHSCRCDYVKVLGKTADNKVIWILEWIVHITYGIMKNWGNVKKIIMAKRLSHTSARMCFPQIPRCLSFKLMPFDFQYKLRNERRRKNEAQNCGRSAQRSTWIKFAIHSLSLSVGCWHFDVCVSEHWSSKPLLKK